MDEIAQLQNVLRIILTYFNTQLFLSILKKFIVWMTKSLLTATHGTMYTVYTTIPEFFQLLLSQLQEEE